MDVAKMGCSKGMLLICIVCFTSILSVVYASFSPQDKLFITCGGNKALVLDDGRVFEPESGNPDVILSSDTHNAVSVLHDMHVSMSNHSLLYRSAKVIRETSSYSFSTRQIGRHWIRLHFYLIETRQFHLKSAVFSVVANGMTLLHGFSFSKLGKVSRLVKEYVVEVDGSMKLVLTLSPQNGLVAFVNATEVVSVPNDQFPSTNIMAVPLEPGFEIPSHVALETAYRINMGGPYITPMNDTLWRTWEPDHAYLVNAASARNVTANPRLIKYPNGVSVEIAPRWYPNGVSVEIAPRWVYAAAQEMADANVLNQKFNISWAFKVEKGFSYLIRLHFCDIVSASLNHLLFNVYINQQSALDSFDISSRTMALSTAYFIDFVTNVSIGADWILVQIGPPMLGDLPSNAIFNGLEIMKMSNSRDSLDGNLPGEYYADSKSPTGKKKWMLLAICSASAGLVVCVFISCFLFVSA